MEPYIDDEDVKKSPRSLRSTHKTILPPSPREKERAQPDIEDQFVDNETLKTKGSEPEQQQPEQQQPTEENKPEQQQEQKPEELNPELLQALQDSRDRGIELPENEPEQQQQTTEENKPEPEQKPEVELSQQQNEEEPPKHTTEELGSACVVAASYLIMKFLRERQNNK